MLIEKVKQTGTTDSNYQLGTVLWENEHPDQDFAEQNITLGSDDYDYLELYFHFGTSSATASMAIIKIKKGDKTYASYSRTLDNGTLLRTYTRNIEFVDDVTLSMSDCYMRENTTAAVSGANMIPVTIIGYKNTIPTVVQKEEEIFDDQERVIGTWFGKPLYRKGIYLTSGWQINAEKQLNHNIDNVEMIWLEKAFYKRSDNSFQLIPNVHSQLSSWGSGIFDMFSDTYKLWIGNIGSYTIQYVYIIFNYTKTTD